MRSHPERRVGFLVEYDGTDFFGWQDQGPTLPSIQGTIETVVSEFLGQRTQIIGSSRTDAGVHAQAQVAAFSFMHPIEVKGLEKVLNRRLPPTISVKKMRLVAPLFFPRHAVSGKTYRYRLYSSKRQRPLLDRYSTRTGHVLDVNRMQCAAAHLIGEHDFKSFAASDHQSRSTVKNLKSINVSDLGEGLVNIDVVGSGFLKQMVRNIVGSLIDVGRKHREAVWIEDVLKAKDRSAAGPTAPPRGLTLLDSSVNWQHGSA